MVIYGVCSRALYYVDACCYVLSCGYVWHVWLCGVRCWVSVCFGVFCVVGCVVVCRYAVVCDVMCCCVMVVDVRCVVCVGVCYAFGVS